MDVVARCYRELTFLIRVYVDLPTVPSVVIVIYIAAFMWPMIWSIRIE